MENHSSQFCFTIHTKISFAMAEGKIGDNKMRRWQDKEYGSGGKTVSGVGLSGAAEKMSQLSRNDG